MRKIHPLLDEGKQQMARQYEKEKRLLALAGMGLSLLLLLVFYYSGLSVRLAHLFPEVSITLTFFVYITVFMTFMSLISLPLSFYSSYRHEHKWKFSNHTVKSWLWEQVKAFFVGLFILFIILSLLFWIMSVFPRTWWLFAGLAMAIVNVIFATVLPVIILPIFNKYTPIQNEELTSSLENVLNQGGLKSSGFFKEDMSRQTKKENAFLAGLGRTRRVVLGDNLMENMSVPEIGTIIAHEVGHFRHRHIWKHIFSGTVQQLVIFFALDQIVRSIFPQFLSSTRANLALLPFLAIIGGAISMLLFSPLSNAVSRHFEREADRYALKAVGDKRPFITALAGLADRNLANAYPEWWVRLLYYSHPPIGERLKMAESH
jgi:STE24 endopeptidase